MSITRFALTGLLAIGGVQERATGVQRLAFVVEVDVERARQVWGTGPEPEGEVVALAARLVHQRFEVMGRAAKVEPETGALRFRVALPSIDPRDRELFEGMLRSMGVCEFLFVAEPSDGFDLEAETGKLESWRAARPDEPLVAFNLLGPENGGPARGLAWFPTKFGSGEGELVEGPPMAVRLPTQAADHFGAASFERCYTTHDSWGYPAIGFDVRESRRDDLARLTETNVNHRLAIVIDGKVRSAPSLNTKLRDRGLIEGRFPDADEVALLVAAFNGLDGPLRLVETR